MNSSFRLLRVRGIEIGANWSYVIVFGLITMSLATSFFPQTYAGLTSTAYWAMAFVTSVLFVVCLLLHELGHAFRAQKEGLEIEGITLWLLGGVAKFKGTFPSAGAEYRIAIAGPAVTLVLVAVFGVFRSAAQTFAAPHEITGVIDYLFQINITLLVFNMLPALPLDGGRVLRSTLWRKRSFLQATVAAARVSRVFAMLMIGVGVLFLVTGAPNGVFLALVGYFLLQAGQQEVAYATFLQLLSGEAIDPSSLRTRPPRRLSLALLLIAAFFGVGFFYSPPFVTFAPGDAFDVTKDITVKGVDTDAVAGGYLLTSVAVQQPNLFGLVGAILSNKPLSPLSEVVPEDTDPDEYFETQEAIFKEAQQTAAAAAAEAAGMDVEITGKGARIADVVKGSPSDGRLEVGDVVVGVNGEKVRLSEDLSQVTRSRPAGTDFELDVLRGGEEITVTVISRTGVVEGSPGIGVSVTTKDLDANLPFTVAFDERDIGGPSAGLAYALAIYDLITEGDLSDGRTVGTTGTIDLEGNVGRVGGVEYKTVAARDEGAEIFLVPADEVREVPRTEGLEVIGVETLEEAIDALRG